MGYKYFKWERNSFFLEFPQNDFSKIINETVAGACSVFVPCVFYTYCCLRYMTLFSSSLVLLPLGLEDSHLRICLAIVMFFFFHGPSWKGYWKQQKYRQAITWTDLPVSCSHEFGILFFVVSTPRSSVLYQDVSSTGLWKDTRVAHTGLWDDILWSCIMMATTEEQWKQNGIVFKPTC